MKEKNKLQENELRSANGGAKADELDLFCICKNCSEKFSIQDTENRSAGSGCKSYKEYKCPKCGTWNRLS